MTTEARQQARSGSYAVGLLLPVSYGTKLLWHLELPFVEPAFVLVLVLWWRRRDLARMAGIEWALSLAFVVSTVAAIRHDQLTAERWLSAWGQCARMFALLASVAWARILEPCERAELFRGLLHGLISVLGLSSCVALIGMGLLPNFLAIDTEYADYSSRFLLRLGPLSIPRFFGLCLEPAPFGALGVAALVLCGNAAANSPKEIELGTRLSWLVVVTSMSDQAFIAVLPLLFARRRRTASSLSWLIAAAVAAVAIPYLVDRLGSRVGEFVSLSDSPEVFDMLWGSSGGERLLNTILALGIATDSMLNLLIGVGPSLFGIFVNELFPVLGDRHQVQVLPADLLCSLGLFGTSLVVANSVKWWRDAKGPGAWAPLLALLLTNMFQSDFQSPALGIAIGCSIAGAGAGSPPREQRDLA